MLDQRANPGQAVTARPQNHNDRLVQIYDRTNLILVKLRSIQQAIEPSPEAPPEPGIASGPYGIEALTSVIESNTVGILNVVDHIASYLGAQK